MNEDITRELALEEHRQGMPYGDDPGHCIGCNHTFLINRQEACSHDDVEKIHVSERIDPIASVCLDCGVTRQHVG